MAGVDKDIEGEATPMPGLKIGYLPQEPQLDPDQTVREAVEEGMGEVLAAKERARRGLRRLRRARRRLRQARRRAGRARGASSPPPARDTEHQLEIAADALRLPPWDADDRQAVGRREAPRRAVPPAAVQARHAAARRADQPPRRRIGRLARAVPAALPRHRGGGHPRPLLPRQRRRVDPRARPRPRHSVEGQLQRPGWSRRSERLEQEQKTEEARARRR